MAGRRARSRRQGCSAGARGAAGQAGAPEPAWRTGLARRGGLARFGRTGATFRGRDRRTAGRAAAGTAACDGKTVSRTTHSSALGNRKGRPPHAALTLRESGNTHTVERTHTTPVRARDHTHIHAMDTL